jgi:predicted AlkP superfamily phosphohydrolase/phosphomutase
MAAILGCREAETRGGRHVTLSPSTLPDLPPQRAGRTPVLVVGIDGAEWKVIHRLWEEGKLPTLKRLHDEGAGAGLGTSSGISPVIWTTIATGRNPEDHGITDFVVTTDSGTVPVSSSVRRVPALWNMTTRVGLRTAVLGWWATWPVEEVTGVVVSDRAHMTEERIVYPEAYFADFREGREDARRAYPGLGGGATLQDPWMEDGALRDRIVAHEACRLAGIGFDLMLVYFRGVDIASHRYWKYFEPAGYEGLTPEELTRNGGVIPSVYEATDEALGDLLASLPTESNVFVLSDHGFVAGPEEHFVNLSADRLLEVLGLMVRHRGEVEFARSLAYPVDSPDHARVKKFRLSLAGREPGGSVPPDGAAEARARLARHLERLTYEGGGPVFRVQASEPPQGVDLVAEVNVESPSMKIRSGSEIFDGVVVYIDKISGTHNATTNGIFLAQGPDLVPAAPLQRITVLDVAPTLLYALGLPVAEDFAGRAWTELFTPGFRAAHPLRTVPSWGTMKSWKAESSPEDSRILRELRVLGYIE